MPARFIIVYIWILKMSRHFPKHFESVIRGKSLFLRVNLAVPYWLPNILVLQKHAKKREWLAFISNMSKGATPTEKI